MHDLETRSCISSQLKQFYLEGVSDAVQAGEGDWFSGVAGSGLYS